MGETSDSHSTRYIIVRFERTRPRAASLSKNYGGPEGRPSRKFTRKFTPSSPLANVHFPVALRERSFANVRSVFLSGTFLACFFSRTFSREGFFVNFVLQTFPRNRSLPREYSLPAISQLRKYRGSQQLERPSVRYWTWLSNFALLCDEAFLSFAGHCRTG